MKKGFEDEVDDIEAPAPRVIDTVVFMGGHADAEIPAVGARHMIRIVEFDDAVYCPLDDLVEALGCHRRSAVSDKVLSKVGDQGVEWDWLFLRTQHGTSSSERFLRMDRVVQYAEVLRDARLISNDMAETVDSWSAAFWNHFDPTKRPLVHNLQLVRAKRRPTPVITLDENEWESSSSSSSSSSSPYQPRAELANWYPQNDEDAEEHEMEVVEEEDEPVDVYAPGPRAMTYDERMDAIKAHKLIVNMLTVSLQLMPKDDPEHQHYQTQLHNSMVVARLLAPTMCTNSVVTIDFPQFPRPGQPTVRLSDRLRALGYDALHLEDEARMRIALDAAARYRRSRFAGPFKVSVWAGTRRVQRYHYTEETQHFLDEAIEAEMARRAQPDGFRAYPTWKRPRIERVVSVLEEEEADPQAPMPMQDEVD